MVFGVVVVVLTLVSSAWAGNPPSADVNRLLFPAQEAMGSDSLGVAERYARKALALDPGVTETHLLLADVFWRRGEYSKAKTAYLKALELGGAEARAQAGFALVSLAEEDLVTAERAAQAALKADNGEWLAHYAMGRVWLEKGDIDKAFDHFSKGKGLKGRSEGRDLFETGMGQVSLAEGDAPGAETSFIKARALAPNTVEHTMNLAAMYESTNQWGQAIHVLRAAEEKVGSSPVLSFRLGRAYEEQRQWNDALRQYQRALKADSTYAPALAALGHLYLLDRTKIGAAIQTLTRAVELQPTPRARLHLGIALTRAGQAPQALQHLEAALHAEPTIEVQVATARAYVQADQLDKALPLYADIDVQLEAEPSDLVQLGGALIKAKDYETARTYLHKARDRDPKLSDVYLRLGLIELLEQNYEGAIENFQKKIDMDPGSATSYINLGIAHQGNGDQRAALAAYRQATRKAPNAAPAWIRLGQALAADSLGASQKAFQRALSLDAESAAAKRGLGFTYLLQEKYAQSIGLLTEATRADPDNTDGWVWLGQAQLNSGRHAEADQAFRHALRLDPSNASAVEGLELIRR